VLRVLRYVSGHIEMETEGAGRLLVRERAYPGWVATVDTHKIAWKEADNLWLSLQLPAGKHRVVFDYRPASVRWGLALTGCGLLLVGWQALRKS
jgi:uncharacterized membrane protein YfhO